VEDWDINDTVFGTGMSSVMQTKFKKAISQQMDIIAKTNFAWYNYASDKNVCSIPFASVPQMIYLHQLGIVNLRVIILK